MKPAKFAFVAEILLELQTYSKNNFKNFGCGFFLQFPPSCNVKHNLVFHGNFPRKSNSADPGESVSFDFY